MDNLKEILEQTGVKAFRLLCKLDVKPNQYFTFQRIAIQAECSADDEVVERGDLFRVTLFSKSNFESLLEQTIDYLKSAQITVQSVGSESYESDTGYFLTPINIYKIKE